MPDDLTDWAERLLGYRFRDAALLRSSLTHKSATGNNNERLEFLGDAVLDSVISEMLFDRRPDATEGELSRLRSSLVRDRSLAAIAVELGIGNQLELGLGERKSGGYRRQSILADAMEALLGAVLKDGGYASVEAVIRRLFEARLEALPDDADLKDPKTRLQEWLQARGLGLPAYEIDDITGKPHAQTFSVSVVLPGSEQSFPGKGTSRRLAEQAAAKSALASLEP